MISLSLIDGTRLVFRFRSVHPVTIRLLERYLILPFQKRGEIHEKERKQSTWILIPIRKTRRRTG